MYSTQLVLKILCKSFSGCIGNMLFFVVRTVIIGLQFIIRNIIITQIIVYVDILRINAIILLIVGVFIVKFVCYILKIIFFPTLKSGIFFHLLHNTLFKLLSRQLNQLHQLNLLR